MSNIIIFALICGALGLLYSILTAAWVLKQDAGSERMRAISDGVREGATAFLRREYSTVAMVGVVLVILLFIFLGTWTAVGFVIGAVGSALAGYIGMMVSVRSNVRTAQAAFGGLAKGLRMAARGGSVTGMMVVSLGLLSVAGYYAFLTSIMPGEEAFRAMIGLGFGCSLMSVFARIAGGIYTKAADVGADLVGKV